jgi:hypothetical protein
MYRALGGGWVQHTGDEPRPADDPGKVAAPPPDDRWWCWAHMRGC